MAAREAAEAHTAAVDNRKQKEATASADAAEPDALRDLQPGRESCGISRAVAPVIGRDDFHVVPNPSNTWDAVERVPTINEKGAVDETSNQVPKSVTPAKELQTKSNPSNPTGQDAVRFPPGAVRSKTKNHKL